MSTSNKNLIDNAETHEYLHDSVIALEGFCALLDCTFNCPEYKNTIPNANGIIALLRQQIYELGSTVRELSFKSKRGTSKRGDFGNFVSDLLCRRKHAEIVAEVAGLSMLSLKQALYAATLVEYREFGTGSRAKFVEEMRVVIATILQAELARNDIVEDVTDCSGKDGLPAQDTTTKSTSGIKENAAQLFLLHWVRSKDFLPELKSFRPGKISPSHAAMACWERCWMALVNHLKTPLPHPVLVGCGAVSRRP